MPSSTFYSPWHSCLYGIGGFYAGNDKSCNSIVSEVTHCFFSNQASASRLEEHVSPHQELRVACLRNAAGINNSENGRSDLFSALLHQTCVSTISDKNLMPERERYEFLMTIAWCYHIFTKATVQTEETLPEASKYYEILQSIANPFYYARAAGVLCQMTNKYFEHRSLKCNSGSILLRTVDRYLKEMDALRSLESDDVHTTGDYIVFSGSLLRAALVDIYSVQYLQEHPQYHRLNEIILDTFENSVSIASKASQFTFYRNFGTHSFSKDQHCTYDDLNKIAGDYIKKSLQNDPYGWLRASYLLFEFGRLGRTESNCIDVLKKSVIQRLRNTRAGISPWPNTNVKYDNDMLSLCYSIMLWRYLDDKNIGDEVKATFQIISPKLPGLPFAEINKLVFACICATGWHHFTDSYAQDTNTKKSEHEETSC